MTQTSNFSESFKAVQNVGKQCVYRKCALWQIQLENLMLQSVTKFYIQVLKTCINKRRYMNIEHLDLIAEF